VPHPFINETTDPSPPLPLLAPPLQVLAHRRNRDWFRAVQLLQLMEVKGITADKMTYSYVLSLLVDCKRYDIAVDVYKNMLAKGTRYVIR